jgi:hypothetical protein
MVIFPNILYAGLLVEFYPRKAKLPALGRKGASKKGPCVKTFFKLFVFALDIVLTRTYIDYIRRAIRPSVV